MKRDMELVREILFLLESQEDGAILEVPEGLDKYNVASHLEIMSQANLVKGKTIWADNEPFWMQYNLTWQGHDFIDSIRSESVWNKIKSTVKDKGLEIGGLTIDVIAEMAKSFAKDILGLN